jgi:hypothetical protein
MTYQVKAAIIVKPQLSRYRKRQLRGVLLPSGEDAIKAELVTVGATENMKALDERVTSDTRSSSI